MARYWRRRRTQPVVSEISQELQQQEKDWYREHGTLIAAIEQWLTWRRALLLLGISAGVTVWIFVIGAWNRGAEQREEQAFRRHIMQQLTSRLCAEEIEQIREQARPVTAVNQTVYVDRDMTPGEYNRAIRDGQWQGELKARDQEQANRLRWGMVAAMHGLTKTEMTVLCGPPASAAAGVSALHTFRRE